ncbi:AAA family ATPase [Nocardia paucivorans]|uniref:AAA family ATPase n=1 Tax=Nocardia paucivorans TaxID=114259 RepID=UPI0002D93770|nr:AAA family ATPase [Nocardia paucivorans]
MLRSFRVTNHKSLVEPQELRLVRGNGPVAVPVTAIHGGPAAGKSNLIDALAQMRDAVLNSVTGWDPYAGPVRSPHIGYVDRPTEFEAVFLAEGCPYTYGFRLDSAEVAAEWLYSHPHSRKRIVFERMGDRIRVGPMFEAARYGITALTPLVRPNSLLLGLAGQIYAEALVPAYRWFDTLLEVVHGAADPAAVELRLGAHLSRSTENAARLLTLLQSADLGITDLLIAQHDPGYAEYLSELDTDIAGLAEQIERCAASPAYAQRLEQDSGVTPVALARELTNMRNARDALYTRMVDRYGVGLRLVHDGVDPVFTLAEESTATVALLRLLPILLDALDTGRVLAVDDIGAHLTVEETDRLVQLFQNPETNTRGAQLIYTTGDRALVDRGNGRSQRTRSTVWQIRRTEYGAGVLEAR